MLNVYSRARDGETLLSRSVPPDAAQNALVRIYDQCKWLEQLSGKLMTLVLLQGEISLREESVAQLLEAVKESTADKLEKLHFLLHTSPKRTALFWLIFTVPGTPKDLLCYFAGLTDLPWGTWLLIATVGRLPSIVTSTVGGSALGEQNYRAAVIAFALALAVAGVGYVIYRAVCRRHGQKPDNTKTDG